MHKQTQITLIRHHGQIYIFIYTKSYIIYDLALMKFASHSGIYFSVFFMVKAIIIQTKTGNDI